MNILFITAQTPWGKMETFLIEEFLAMKHQGIDFLIIPRNPPNEVFHKEVEGFLSNSIQLPLINVRMILHLIKMIFTRSSFYTLLWSLFVNSRNLFIFLKNITILPKAIYICQLIKNKNITHIHAHWGSTTSTIAYIVSRLHNIQWSFTLHRWDIKENNMLKEKVRSASFARCISLHGKNELLDFINKKDTSKIIIIHLGISVHDSVQNIDKKNSLFTIITPALLFEVKGHKYLIEACGLLVKKGITDFKCIFYGDGYMESSLANAIREYNLSDFVLMPGFIPHHELLDIYKNREADLVILSSINTHDAHEGIPVSLMEAMSYGIPVISTDTGGIPELLSNGAGILVKEKSPEQLAEAIIKVMQQDKRRKELIKKGYQVIKNKFDVSTNIKQLIECIKNSK